MNEAFFYSILNRAQKQLNTENQQQSAASHLCNHANGLKQDIYLLKCLTGTKKLVLYKALTGQFV